ncbi:MAG: ABC transporter permease [Anaerolineales bacterium]
MRRLFPFLEKRLEPSESPLVIGGLTVLSVLLALLIGGFLFLPFKADPGEAYLTMLQQSFGSLKGIGFTLVRATPLIFIGLGTIVAWRTGFFYLGFEGALLIGAAMTVWVALLSAPDAAIGPLPPAVFFLLVFAVSFIAGGVWASIVGILRGCFGSNEVIVSLMMNYVAIFIVNYLVSGPLRAPGDLPQTPRIPEATILPFIIPMTRAHAGILAALVATLVMWLLLRKTPLGYELIVAGLSPRAARYGGINVGNRQILASFLAGGLAAWAGLVTILGVQYRLLDGISEGTGFVGIVAALLGKLNPLGVVIASILYAAMGVGADAMQRRAGLPSSVVFIVQSLIVLLVLASDLLRYYRINFATLRGGQAGETPADTAAIASQQE